MKKRIMIISISAFVMVALCVSVFAAFMFNKKINGKDNTTGDIEINDKWFVDYSDKDDYNLRTDTYYSLSSISLIESDSYNLTEDKKFQQTKTYYVEGTFEKATIVSGSTIVGVYYEDSNGRYLQTTDITFLPGKIYYNKSSNNGYTATISVTIGNDITANTYYEKITSYTGVRGAQIYSKNGYTVQIDTINNNNIDIKNGDIKFDTLTLNFDSSGIKSATSTISDAKVIVGNDGISLIVIDKSKVYGTSTKITSDNKTITCSATKDKYTDDQIYLNQLGLEFEFTNTVAVYVRIHIQDAWILHRVYSSNSKETYSIKDQSQGNSLFYVEDGDWYYDSAENTVYMREMVNPEKDNNSYKSKKYRFDVNQAYYYISKNQASAYHEYVDVQVSFYVDIVQANRVKEKWGIDPSTLFSK